MSEPYLGEIRAFGFNFPPKGWLTCSGQLLAINQNQALFSLLGTTYGGNGTTTFGLPNLNGCVPVHAIGGSIQLGEMSGVESVTLTVAEMPAHSHSCLANAAAVDNGTPVGHTWGKESAQAYGAAQNGSMHVTAILSVGGGQPHSNMQPYLVLNFCIATQGIFPSRS